MNRTLFTFFLSLALPMAALAQDWQFIAVDGGVKPALALAPDGTPHISYMLEDRDGYVRHAGWNATAGWFDATTVSTGYFYGPLAVAVDAGGQPHINYHDHTFEDQVHAYRTDAGWTVERIEHTGHDGWDNAMVIDDQGTIHTSTIDPSGFNGAGVEYAVSMGAGWTIQAVGSRPIMYANATTLALDSQRRPRIAYFDDGVQDLMYAERDAAGVWTISTVDAEGDVGRFASLRLDAEDTAHLSYYQHLEGTTGVVKYAVKTAGAWTISTVDTLHNVTIGFIGARNLTALALDDGGRPHLAYSDAQTIVYARRMDDGTWMRQTVLDVPDGAAPLGQLTSMALDAEGRPHLAYFEVTNRSPLDGVVWYARPASATAAESPELPEAAALLHPYPNPFGDATRLAYTLPRAAHVTLRLFDVLGRAVAAPVDALQPAGRHEVAIDSEDWAPGIYLAVLQLDGRPAVHTLLVRR